MEFSFSDGNYKASVRLMTAGDIESVARLGQATPELRAEGSRVSFYSSQQLEKFLMSKQVLVLVAHIERSFAGFCLSEYNLDTGRAQIQSLVVEKEYHKRGIGSTLIEAMLRELTLLGIDRVFGLVQIANIGTKEFFKRHGFAIGANMTYVEKIL